MASFTSFSVEAEERSLVSEREWRMDRSSSHDIPYDACISSRPFSEEENEEEGNVPKGKQEEDETEEEEIDDDETDDDYERFKDSLIHDEDPSSTIPGSSTAKKRKHPQPATQAGTTAEDLQLCRKPHVNLKKMCSATSRDLVLSSTIIESDYEYETEEIIELREWYPPDYWKSSLNQEISLTDVTVNDFTVTLTESRRSEGFFKEL